MDVRNTESIGENFLHSIIRAVRKFWILIIAVVVAAVAVGGVIAVTKTPKYTVYETVVYKAQNIHSDSTVNNINAMNAFLGTIVDFCDEEVVVDRANYYYAMYLNEKAKAGENYTVDDYVETVKQNDTYKYEEINKHRIFASNIEVVSSEADEDGTKFSFVINYTDLSKDAAKDKVKILILAADMESKETVVVDNVSQNKYFAGINSEFLDYGTGSITSDVSIPKILIISFVIGLIAAFVVVYLLNMLDNTVKTKGELQEITGVDTLAFISEHGGK